MKETRAIFWKTSGYLCLIGIVCLGLMGLVGACSSDSSSPPTPSPKVETTRDAKGVWFISGEEGASLYDVKEAMGYAVATDRLWQAETFRRQARGRLAEILGIALLGTDVYFRTLSYSDQELQDGFDALDLETEEVINGYVAGFNRRIAEVRNDESLLPFEFAALGIVPEDWTVLDILAWTAWLQRMFDSEAMDTTQVDNTVLYLGLMENFPTEFQGMFDDSRWINDPDALTYIPPEVTLSVPDKAEDPMGLSTGEARMSPMDAKTATAFSSDIHQAAKNMAENRNGVVESLKKINAYVKLGSYAWTVSGTKTVSGNPMIYSGPQMGFPVPSIVLEGSIRAAGLNVSGMSVAGIPGIIIGRTPHHAWSMQVGCTHTVDYYIEDPASVSLHRVETIKVAGEDDVQLPVYRSNHGPVINPMPYDPATYDPTTDGPIISWKYSQWGYEFAWLKGGLDLARATSMDEFGEAIELVNFSIHYCYADRDGNIAYWMAGRDPVRPEGEWRLPQGFLGPALEWDSKTLIPRSTDRNTSKGFYSGWNNKSRPNYNSGYNATWLTFGPFHRAQVIDDYLSTHNNLTFEELRDLALNIATTDSFGSGGNPWKFVADDFKAVVEVAPTPDQQAALALLESWDGHFVDGGPSEWVSGKNRADAWVLMDAWIREAIRLTFADELGSLFEGQDTNILFNALLHGLAGQSSGIVNNYNWFQNLSDPSAPQTADAIIVAALDTVLSELGAKPWGTDARGVISYTHDMLGEVWEMPFASRSTYAHCVEFESSGPVRIESMFPLGESGTILMDEGSNPVYDDNFLSMTPVFDAFAPRDFPLFE